MLVLFHHGDFTYGGAVDPLLYGGDYVNAHQDVVLVSFNYRLGIFGFIDFSDIPGGEACPDTLNLGLLDQIAALKCDLHLPAGGQRAGEGLVPEGLRVQWQLGVCL